MKILVILLYCYNITIIMIIKLIILNMYYFKYNYCNICDIIDNYYDNIITNINYKYIIITILQNYKLFKVGLNITDIYYYQ